MLNKTDTTTTRAARLPLLALCLAALLALAGCGGGCDEDEPDLQRRNPSVDCAARPELCK